MDAMDVQRSTTAWRRPRRWPFLIDRRDERVTNRPHMTISRRRRCRKMTPAPEPCRAILRLPPRTPPISSSPVKIAGRPSLRCGGEMRVDAPSAMRAVSRSSRLTQVRRLMEAGLYHKLHGVHRPVAMKKSIIKRRKRVVPATQESEAGHALHVTSFPVSAPPNSHFPEHLDTRHQPDSPGPDLTDPVPVDIRNHLDYHAPHDSHPLGVDFTGYRMDQQRRPSSRERQEHGNLPLPSIHEPSTLGSPPELQRTLTPYAGPSKKRSFSDAQLHPPASATPDSPRPNRLSSISSLLNPAYRSAADDAMIDPSLSSIGQPPRRHSHLHSSPRTHPPDIRLRSPVAGDPGGEERAEKRARLHRESQELRRQLREVEQELHELGDEE